MANRYLSSGPFQIRNENETISYTVNVTANNLRVKIQHQDTTSDFDGDVVYTLLDWDLPLENLKSSSLLKSNSLIGISVPSVRANNQNTEGTVEIKTTNLINSSHFSKSTKSKSAFSGQFHHIPSYISIFVKDVDGDFTDHDIILYVPEKEYALESNVEFTDTPDGFSHVSLLDTITATKDNTYVDDLYVKYNVTTESYVGEVYVEPVIGIVDRTRVAINSSGVGSFRLLKSSLIAGESPRIKLGFYSYSGIAEITS